MFFAILYSLTLHLCCGFALFFGSKVEKIAAIAMYVASMTTWATLELSPIDHQSMEIGVLAIDMLLLLLLGSMALRFDKYWLLFATAFHLVGVVIHVAVVANSNVEAGAYAHALAFWTYMVLFSLAAGTKAEHSRRKKSKAS